MPRSRVVHSALGILLLTACGGSDGTAADASIPSEAGPCWPIPSTPGGEIELGTGDLTFEPLGDTLEIIASPAQSDPFVQVHARIRDLPPGNANDILDPANPRTKASLVIESLGLALGVDCPARIPYIPAPASGAFDLVHSLHVGFGFMPIDQVPGSQGRVTIEIVGSDGHYAKAEKLVTLIASPPAAR
jgi:hypothetical protein